MMTRRHRRGATGMQYASILALIVMVSILAIVMMGGSVRTLLTGVANRLGNEAGPGPGSGATGGGGPQETTQLWGSGSILYHPDGSSSIPVNYAPPGLGTIVSGANIWDYASSAGRSVCLVNTAGEAQCKGANDNGRLGRGTIGGAWDNTFAPVVAGGGYNGSNMASVSAGTGHYCGRLTSGGIACWGANGSNAVGNGAGAANTGTPSALATNSDYTGGNVTSVQSGHYYNGALTNDGRVLTWGANGEGQLARDCCTNGEALAIKPSTGYGWTGANARSLAVGGSHACLVSTAGKAFCWGWNQYGQLGLNNTPGMGAGNVVWPVAEISGYTGSNMQSIAAGSNTSCGIVSSGAVLCWGGNAVANGVSDGSNHGPVAVNPGGSYTGGNAASLAMVGDGVCARLSSGNAACWGEPIWGSLGIGTNVTTYTPTDAVGLTGIISMQGNTSGYMMLFFL